MQNTRIVPLCVLLVSASLTFAQTEQLPDILKPDPASEFEAKRMGAQVFKLVPRGMFEDPHGSFEDEENPLGIRGGGAYFSFLNRSHSYNKVPQISLSKDGRLTVGFYGSNYGFFVDLGRREFGEVESNLAEARYVLSYRPPLYEVDSHPEHISIHGRRVDQFTLWSYVPAVVGDTYLLRAISWEQADTVVALQVLKIDTDGSATIAWKKLADFGKPFQLVMPDEELQMRVGAAIAEERILGVEFTIRDNWLYFRGSASNFRSLYRALRSRGIRYRGQTLTIR